jgi:predicted pyridoxine 5'-phosphate oxidase superfamily flavin-nucleotide-binding protein
MDEPRVFFKDMMDAKHGEYTHTLQWLAVAVANKNGAVGLTESETAATVDAAEITARATDWATHFYKDLLHIENSEFRDRPPRFWLTTFVRSNGEKVYAAVLPD